MSHLFLGVVGFSEIDHYFLHGILRSMYVMYRIAGSGWYLSAILSAIQ